MGQRNKEHDQDCGRQHDCGCTTAPRTGSTSSCGPLSQDVLKAEAEGGRSPILAAARRVSATGSSSGISVTSRDGRGRGLTDVGCQDRPAPVKPRPDGAGRHFELDRDLLDGEPYDRV